MPKTMPIKKKKYATTSTTLNNKKRTYALHVGFIIFMQFLLMVLDQPKHHQS